MSYRMMRIYFDSDGGEGNGGNSNSSGDDNGKKPTEPHNQAPPAFDYDKLAGIIAGKQNVTEETILKNYFKQQGLSQEEAQSAMSAFKEQKAKNTPDVAALQQQASAAAALAQKAQLEQRATFAALDIGLDAKTIPYVLKMADMTNVLKDGKIDDEAVKAAVNKVLEDVPMLKPAVAEKNGFRIGGDSGASGNQTQKTKQNIVPTKRWNRFN